jgi:hypothetical protein
MSVTVNNPANVPAIVTEQEVAPAIVAPLVTRDTRTGKLIAHSPFGLDSAHLPSSESVRAASGRIMEKIAEGKTAREVMNSEDGELLKKYTRIVGFMKSQESDIEREQSKADIAKAGDAIEDSVTRAMKLHEEKAQENANLSAELKPTKSIVYTVSPSGRLSLTEYNTDEAAARDFGRKVQLGQNGNSIRGCLYASVVYRAGASASFVLEY